MCQQTISKKSNKLEQNDTRRIEEFYPMFENRVKKVKINDKTKYVPQIPHSHLVPLGTVLGYLYNEDYTGKAKCPLKNGTKTALILDSHSIDYLKKIKAKDPKTFELYKKNYLPVYIENFENTYNIFEHTYFKRN